MLKPLSNIKVLDLSRVLAGPFCTMLLSELGAEIVKVEVPGTGDDARAYGPFRNERSLYFISVNRGKKSVSLNLKSEKGKKILHDLIPHFDVLIENFKPGVMDKLGFGYDDVKKINEKIIYASSSGFGHTGPESKKPAYDILVQAMGGVMSITGWPDSAPTRVGMSIGDITASLYTAIGINAALYHRAITGEGQKIDISMLDCQMSILENAMIRYQVDNNAPGPIGNRHPTITPFQGFKAKDDFFVVGVGNDNIWLKFCSAIGMPDLANDARFKTNGLRTKNISELSEILNLKLAEKNVSEWVEILEQNEVPVSPINTIDKAMFHPQVKARNMTVEVEDKVAGKLTVAGNAIKMSGIKEEPTRKSAPEIGEHNIEIFTSLLGYSISEIDQLKSDGII